MKKLALLVVLGAAVAVPAQASTAKHPPYNIKPPKPPKPYPVCNAENAGFYATGTLVSASLTQVSRHTYNGTIAVSVVRANHNAPTGSQTYTLTNARVHFHNGVSSTAPAAGSRVQLNGTITELPDHCQVAGFTPTITVTHVDIRRAPRGRQNRQ